MTSVAFTPKSATLAAFGASGNWTAFGQASVNKLAFGQAVHKTSEAPTPKVGPTTNFLRQMFKGQPTFGAEKPPITGFLPYLA